MGGQGGAEQHCASDAMTACISERQAQVAVLEWCNIQVLETQANQEQSLRREMGSLRAFDDMVKHKMDGMAETIQDCAQMELAEIVTEVQERLVRLEERADEHAGLEDPPQEFDDEPIDAVEQDVALLKTQMAVESSARYVDGCMQNHEDSFEKALERFITQRRALQQDLQEVRAYGQVFMPHLSERVSSARQGPQRRPRSRSRHSAARRAVRRVCRAAWGAASRRRLRAGAAGAPRAAPLTRRRSAPNSFLVHMVPGFNPPPGPPLMASPAERRRGRRRQRFGKCTIGFVKVVDSDLFDLGAFQATFPEARFMVVTTQMKWRLRLSKTQVMWRPGRGVRKRIRLFEQGHQIFLHEPLDCGRAKVFLTEAPSSPRRYWSGATGSSSTPQPCSGCPC